jgi:hypothetical protein
MKTLVSVAWTLWGVDLLIVLYCFALVAGDRSGSWGKPIAYFLLSIMMALLAGATWLVNWLARHHSTGGLSTVVAILGWPLVFLVASFLITGTKGWLRQRDEARVGDFRDPALQQLVEAIRRNDTEATSQLLAAHPNVKGKDRAGNDVLAYAVLRVRDEHGEIETVKLLLDTGLDPNESRVPDGLDLINLVISDQPEADQVVRLLLEHGANPNAVDPATGETPIHRAGADVETVRALVKHGADINQHKEGQMPAVVDFVIPGRHWDAAIYLVEIGADLDIQNPHGVSLDYYLAEWSKGTYGDPPEGFKRLSEAVAARRKANPKRQ